VEDSLGTENIVAITVTGACIEVADEYDGLKSLLHESENRMAVEFVTADEALDFEMRPHGDFELVCENHKQLQSELKEMDAEAEKRQELIARLRDELSGVLESLQSPRHTDPTASFDEEDEVELLRKDELLMAQFESAVNEAKRFKCEGPSDKTDWTIWRNLDSGEGPYLNALLEGQIMAGKLFKLGQKKSLLAGGWSERHGIIHGKFLYYFKKNDGREKPQGAIYLYGCKVDLVRGAYHGRPWCMRINPSVPRRAGDKDLDAANHEFHLSFESESDAMAWKAEIEKIALPPMPKMTRRKGRERAVTMSKATTVASDTAHWKADEEQIVCEECNSKFTTFLRRHHCRTCGGIFCDKCCGKGTEGHRKCKRCIRIETERLAQREVIEVTRRMTVKPQEETHSQMTAEEALSLTVSSMQTLVKESAMPLICHRVALPTLVGRQYLKCYFEARKHSAICYILVDHFAATIGIYSTTKTLVRTYPAAHVLSLQKNPTESTKVTLLFVGKNQTYDFVFKDCSVRERFCETVYAIRPQIRVLSKELGKGDGDIETTLIEALGPNSTSIVDQATRTQIDLSGECKINASCTPTETVLIWVGSYNAKGAKELNFGDLLKKWVPTPASASIYVFNMQGFAGKHEAWFQAAHEFLGREYIPCVNMSQFKMNTIALVRRRQVLKVNNAEATIGNGAFKTMMRVIYPQGETGGVAITFRVLETSICVVNLDLPEDVKQRAQCVRDTLSRMQLGFDCVEITEQFDYLMLAAAMNSTFSSMATSFSEFTPQVEANGSVIASRGKLSSLDTCTPAPNMASCLYTVPVVRPHLQCFQEPSPVVIKLFSISAQLLDKDPVLKGLVHISNSMSCPQRTTSEEEGAGTMSWSLEDYPIVLTPPNTMPDYLSTRCLIFTVRDMSQTIESKCCKGSGCFLLSAVIANGTIPIDVPQEITVPLRHGGTDVGVLTFKFQFALPAAPRTSTLTSI
jgi:hypothetical protein